MSEIEAEAVAAEVPVEKFESPKDRKAGAVDGVFTAKAAHSAATARLKFLREETAKALRDEAKCLEALKSARLVLRREAEGEE